MNRLILTFCLCYLVLSGCQNVDPVETLEFDGEATALRNGEDWHAVISVFEPGSFSEIFGLTLEVYSSNRVRRQALYFNVASKTFDRQQIHSGDTGEDGQFLGTRKAIREAKCHV